jgi:hypothetical protein
MEGRVVIINCLPSFVQRFFVPMRPSLSKPQFSHLWSLVLAIVITLRDAKLLHLSSVTPATGHRTRRGAFLNHSQWDAPALIEQATGNLLSSMKPRAGETLYLILDDTRIAKRGSKMERLSKIWDHGSTELVEVKQQKFVRGHIVLTAAIVFRGVVLPWRLQLWKPRGQPASAYAPRYRKLTDRAATMIRAFELPMAGMKVRVLFDAFYLSPTVCRACEEKGFTFFSVAQRNRSFTSDNGKRRSLAKLMPGLLRHRGRNVHMKRSRGHATLRLASIDGHLSRIGRVRLVVSKRPAGPFRRTVAIVTNETKLDPRRIVAIYETRWLIEVLFKELRQDLGLGDYQMLAEDGIVHHLHICCLAHLLLTHRGLIGLGAQAKRATEQVKLPPMNERLQLLREAIARDQIRRIAKGPEHARLRARLYDHLLAA